MEGEEMEMETDARARQMEWLTSFIQGKKKREEVGSRGEKSMEFYRQKRNFNEALIEKAEK